MNQNEFFKQQQAAIERMREMNAKSQINQSHAHKMPPVPSFVRVNENNPSHIPNATVKENTNLKNSVNAPPHRTEAKNSNFGNSLNIPFLDSILKDSDSTLIIGLLLILMSENSDKMLLFALIYILL